MHTLADMQQLLPTVAALLADVNSDGALDLVGSDVYVRTPASFSHYATLSGTASACGDLNNDGLLDIVVCDVALSVYYQMASGGFTASPSLSLPDSSPWATIVDLNRDGLSDLVTNGQYRLQTAGGVLGPPTNEPLFISFGRPALPIDYLGDGIVDLVVRNSFGGGPVAEAFVVAQTSPLTFTAAAAVGQAVLSEPLTDMVVADVNNDGYADVIWSNVSPATAALDRITVSLGSSAGLTGGGLLSVGTGIISRPRDLSIGDLNNDGLADIAVAQTQSLVVLYGLTGGSWEARVLPGVVGLHVDIGDLTLDGALDVWLDSGVLPARSLMSGEVVAVPVAAPPFQQGGSRVACADGPSGLPDVYLSSLDDVSQIGYVWRCQQINRGGFGATTQQVFNAAQYVTMLDAVDWNGDGAAELAVGSGYGLNIGNVAFASSPGIRDVAYGYLTSGGNLDVVAVNFYFSQVRIVYSDYLQSVIGGPASTPQCYQVSVGDVNGDGRADIVTTCTGLTAVFRQSATGRFSVVPDLTIPSVATAVCDANADGRLDLVGPGGFYFQRADGSLPLAPDRPGVGARDCADMDGNGLVDLVGQGTVWFQVAPGYFRSVAVETGAAYGDLKLLDVDQDGDIDIVKSEPGQVIWRGRG